MNMRHLLIPGALVMLASTSASAAPPRVPAGMRRIEPGSFHPVYARPGERVMVRAFAIDTIAVSERMFTGKPLASRRLAATRVSAAQAALYCKSRGARLPTMNEWEYVARASESARDGIADAGFKQRVLEWAMKSRSRVIGNGLRNIFGIRDMHGGVNEWTADYATAGSHVEHHDGQAVRISCASGAAQTGDASDYAAFIRQSTRSATRGGGSSVTGFRCAMTL